MTDRTPTHIKHHNVAVLTVPDKETLDELVAQANVRSLIWKRLDDTRALVDSGRVELLRRRLSTMGHPARISSAELL